MATRTKRKRAGRSHRNHPELLQLTRTDDGAARMRVLEAELHRLIEECVSRIATLARMAAREMVESALRTDVARPRVRRADGRARDDGARDVFGGLLHDIEQGARPTLDRALAEFEGRYIERVMLDHGDNISHAAKALGLSRQSLQRKRARLRLRRRRRRRRRP